MESTQNNLGNITFNFSETSDGFLIQAISNESIYQKTLAPNSLIDFRELQQSLQNHNFTITSQTPSKLKIHIGHIDLELESSDQAIVNEFQETITTLTNNIESQLQKNARLETEVKTLRTQINELNSKFAQMTQDVMNLTNRIQNSENLQSEINLLKEQINKLKQSKETPENRTNFSEKLIATSQKNQHSGSLIQIQSQQSINIDMTQDNEQVWENVLDFLTKKTSIHEQTESVPAQENQQQNQPSKDLLNAFDIVLRIPKLHWKDFKSNVVTTPQEIGIIKGFFKKNIVLLKLLYRASDNYFSARKFHEKCNGVPNTILFVKTDFGKKIGGYTPLKWQSPNAQNVVNKADPSYESFIFSLTDDDKFTLGNKDIAIVNKASWGPVFGCDLVISDKANQLPNCYAKINKCYQNSKYKKDDWLVKGKFGGGQTNHFKVQQWEVWHIEFGQEQKEEKITISEPSIIGK